MRTPTTLSLPSASAARNAVRAESTPPESPTRPFLKPRRRTTSSLRKLTSHLRVSSGSMARGSSSGSLPATMSTWVVRRASCVGVPFVTGSNFTFSFCFSPLRLRVSTGRALCKSASSGESERAVVSESRSISAVSNASSNSGPRAMTRPVGSITADAPGKPLPPSNPTRFARATNTPCSSAIPRTMRSQRTTEAGSVSPPPTVLRLAQPARRRRARHDDQLRALEGGDGRGQRVPGVLANQDRGLPTPTRLERPHAFLPTIDETLFVEDAVGRQEYLAVHVPHLGLLLVERDIQGGVVDMVLEALVEPHDDIDRRPLTGRGEIARQRAGGDRELLDSAFDEIARRRRVGKDDEVGLGIELPRLRDDGADSRDVVGVLTFGRSELGQRQADVRHVGKILAYSRRWSSPQTALFGLMTPTRTIHGRSFSLTILYIALGGIAGTLSRYGLEGWIQSRTAPGFALGTLTVKLCGPPLLGFILRVATGTTLISPDVRAALTIGFCGAFTTMSTFSYESVALLTDGDYLRAALYMSATILGCVAAVMLGTALGSKLL